MFYDSLAFTELKKINENLELLIKLITEGAIIPDKVEEFKPKTKKKVT